LSAGTVQSPEIKQEVIHMKVNVIGEQISQDEINAYIEYGKKKYSDREIIGMTVKIDGEYVDLQYDFENIPFDRIRRITGYLVGTLDRFNNGKRAEEHDRVKHNV
jgi:anaerobic ribonucleoside-triphosphate reductase